MPSLYLIRLRRAAAIVLLALPLSAAAAPHYFSEHGKIGAKDARGNIIVPAQYPDNGWVGYTEAVRGSEIEFLTSLREPPADDIAALAAVDALDPPARAAADVYDTRGQYLYSPLWYDNGADFWQEGMRRFVEGGKVGFVNGDGEKVIPARYTYAAPFHYGYAQVFVGNWKKQYDSSGEHWSPVPAEPTATTHLIDHSGNAVSGSPVPQSPQDVLLHGRYYPYPFVYNDFERNLLARTAKLPVLGELAHVALDQAAPERQLRYEITARPSRRDPYYQLSAFTFSAQRESFRHDDFTLVADRRGRLFHRDFFGETVPLQTWLRDQLRQTQQYLREHPDKPNRFDVRRRLRELERTAF